MNDQASHRRPARRRFRIACAVLGLMALTVGIVSLTQSRRAQSQLEEIRKAGYPVTLAELNDWYPSVPVDQNAAFKILEAYNQLVSPVTSFAGDTPLKPEDRALLNRFLTNNAAALKLAHEAAGLKQCRYMIDLNQGANVLLPHLAQIKQLVQQLRNVAILHSEEGRPEAALQSYRDALAVAQSMAPEPLLISQLVRMACLAIAQSALEKILTRHQLAEAPLREIAAELREAESLSQPAFARGLVGERCLGIHAFQLPLVQFVRMMDPNATGGSAIGVGVLFGVTKITGLRNRDFSFYRRIMRDWVDFSRLPFPEALEKSKDVSNRLVAEMQGVKKFFRPVSVMLLPALDKAISRAANEIALLRAAQAAMSIERHRLKNGGQLPESLEALVPGVIADVPKDPIDGKPLRYKKLEAGYVIYSVGTNGKDDGGVTKGSLDVAFRVDR